MPEVNLHYDALGTVFALHLFSDHDRDGIDASIQNYLTDFEKTYSRFRSDSLLSLFEHRTGVIEVPEECVQLFRFFAEIETLTSGVFTPCIGRALSDAGYDRNYSFIEKQEKMAIPRLCDVVRLLDNRHIELLQPFLFDFGGIAKGWCIDRIALMIEEHGHASFLINGSGDMLYRGEKSLRCGLEDPADPSKVLGVFPLNSGSLCGSSGSRRKWRHHHHILHPKTHESPKTILATWVWSEHALLADAMATCLFLVDPALLQKKYVFEYAILYDDSSVEQSAAFDAEMFVADERVRTKSVASLKK